MEDNFINTIVSLHKDNEWKKIIEFGEFSKCNEITRKLLWVWPSLENLNFIKNLVKLNGLKGVTSIGCGSGLFEWLLQQATELSVIGLEVNKEWWTSKYCSPQFIPLTFPNMPPKSEDLNEDYALLFCYFNHGPAFAEYVKAYKGDLIFIIGPGKGRGTHTNPEPFKPNFETSASAAWELCAFEEVRDTKDFIAAYVRVKC